MQKHLIDLVKDDCSRRALAQFIEVIEDGDENSEKESQSSDSSDDDDNDHPLVIKLESPKPRSQRILPALDSFLKTSDGRVIRPTHYFCITCLAK